LNIEAEKQALDEKLAANRIFASQKLAALRELTAQEFVLNEQALQDELKPLHEGTAEYEKVYNQIRELKAKLVVDLAALDQSETAQRALIDEALHQLGGGVKIPFERGAPGFDFFFEKIV